MVRATLRELTFIWDKRNQDQVLDIIVKEFKPSSRKMANETLNQFMRVITKDAFVRPESVQTLVDLVRESTNVTRPVAAAEVIDFSFLEKAQKQLGLR
ncbi:MAG TPA: hypothetical protein VK200_03680 [Candidatus Limnocylindrales bacterium]|nr:hypothetical protein [Candidatus Limnocylindrales bacterium]